jgi:hypothetical protein
MQYTSTNHLSSWVQWLTPIILAAWEAEIRRLAVPGQPRHVIPETPSPKQPEQNGVEVWLKW